MPEPKWEGEVEEELSSLLGAAIEKKQKKVAQKGILNTCDGIILALYDAYGFSDIETARQAFSRLQGYEWLHSIYWVASFTDRPNILYPDNPGRYGEFLYSKDSAWHLCTR